MGQWQCQMLHQFGCESGPACLVASLVRGGSCVVYHGWQLSASGQYVLGGRLAWQRVEWGLGSARTPPCPIFLLQRINGVG